MTRSNAVLIEEFINSLQQQNKSAHTLKNYRSDIEHFVRWSKDFLPKKLTHVSPSDIQSYSNYLAGKQDSPRKIPLWKKVTRWVASFFSAKKPQQMAGVQRPRPMAVASRRRHLSSLKNFFEYHCQSELAQRRGLVKNPVRSKLHAIGLKDKDVKHTKTLTREQFFLLLESATKLEQRLAIWILYDGALRLEELSRLKFGDFHAPSKTLRFIRKGGSWHTLKLENFSKIEELLKAHQLKTSKHSEDWVFGSQTGKALTPRSHYNRLKRLFEKAQLPSELTPHSFRKGRATLLYAQTKDLLYVRDYLNHKDAKVTQTYIDTQYLYS